ncbi:hypothetical protein [uncultured Shewanella sp.]|uniref:hypothetical protein n=1 Tax=uncultured Shewanella sp. TaxID=173975 RepID=UPI002639B87A|nr:hypothetical protein [uncultured Shewanella sp.]
MINRRHFLSKITQFSFMSLFSTPISVIFNTSAKPLAPEISLVTVPSITSYFLALDYQTAPPQSLITGHSFNGGVRYDETRQTPLHGNALTVQNCIRIHDITTMTSNETLPYFHIIALSRERPQFKGQILFELLSYLVKPLHLAPNRLVLVSTDRINAYLPIIEKVGIKKAQIIYRSDEEAHALGDGSGYFNPKGHPYIDGIHTVSFHYALDPSIMNRPLQYPLTGAIELGEFVVADPRKEQQSETGGFGLERLQMAQTGQSSNYDRALHQAITHLEKEAKQLNQPLPKAYEILKASG